MCVRYREQAHASPVAVEEVSLKGRSAGFLIVPVTLGFVLIVPASDVYHWLRRSSNVHAYLLQLYQELPCGSQGPRHTQQKSAWMSGLAKIWENLFHLATLVLADHVVAASILLNGGSTLHFVDEESSSAFSIYDATF